MFSRLMITSMKTSFNTGIGWINREIDMQVDLYSIKVLNVLAKVYIDYDTGNQLKMKLWPLTILHWIRSNICLKWHHAKHQKLFLGKFGMPTGAPTYLVRQKPLNPLMTAQTSFNYKF